MSNRLAMVDTKLRVTQTVHLTRGTGTGPAAWVAPRLGPVTYLDGTPVPPGLTVTWEYVLPSPEGLRKIGRVTADPKTRIGDAPC